MKDEQRPDVWPLTWIVRCREVSQFFGHLVYQVFPSDYFLASPWANSNRPDLRVMSIGVSRPNVYIDFSATSTEKPRDTPSRLDRAKLSGLKMTCTIEKMGLLQCVEWVDFSRRINAVFCFNKLPSNTTFEYQSGAPAILVRRALTSDLPSG